MSTRALILRTPPFTDLLCSGELLSGDKSDSASEVARQWEIAIRQALMPVTNNANAANATNINNNVLLVEPADAKGAGNGKAGAEAKAEAKEAASAESDMATKDISQLYQIFPDEVLGSGQFGIVYGGVHRTTGHSVAIKVSQVGLVGIVKRRA